MLSHVYIGLVESIWFEIGIISGQYFSEDIRVVFVFDETGFE